MKNSPSGIYSTQEAPIIAAAGSYFHQPARAAKYSYNPTVAHAASAVASETSPIAVPTPSLPDSAPNERKHVYPTSVITHAHARGIQIAEPSSTTSLPVRYTRRPLVTQWIRPQSTNNSRPPATNPMENSRPIDSPPCPRNVSLAQIYSADRTNRPEYA